ncbi:hypothetical protein GCM10027275_54980 [Rhabdobacter roseus]|uniref:DUF4271 domain-containing protein n=1 Tax=Rhabdobacter roseus TaxID=1655419 RepID=A0A840U1P5_9BACT|nr:DUF4271 domain-containing protein [Rhabdobacter roseus]MBB5287513.1 hypothetical protein [Rhabdobacter roseus]
MNVLRPLLFFALVLAGALSSRSVRADNEVGPGQKYYLVYDLRNDWLTYSSRYQNYVPFSKGIHEAETSASLLVDLLKNRPYTLLIQSRAESYLFIEGALQKRIAPGTWLELSLDSLYRNYRKEELLLTLYGSPGVDDKNVLVGHLKKENVAALPVSTSPLINIRPKFPTPFGDFSVLVFLFFLALNALTYTISPNTYRRLINPADYFNRDDRSEIHKFNKPYSRPVLLFVIQLSLIVSYLLLALANYDVNLFSAGTLLSERDQLSEILLDFLKLFGATFLLFYLKYVYMSLVGGMLNLDPIVDLHFLKALQSSYFFYSLLGLLVFTLSLHEPGWFESMRPFLLLPFVAFYLLRFFSLYFVTNSRASLMNLHLFSYLCVIEIIPLIIGVKFAL